jgi:pimeloyl-ACP methyl ester carboxylesterase
MEPEPAPVHLSSAWKNEVYVKDKDKGERGISSPSLYTSSNSPLLPTHTSSTVSRVVDWQISHHPAFVPAFISSIQHTPVHGQCAAWAKIGERLHHQNGCASDPEAQALGLEGGKVLVLLGSRDEIVVASEVGYDVKRVLGKGNVEVHVLEAGHEVPIERIGECAEAVGGYLGL